MTWATLILALGATLFAGAAYAVESPDYELQTMLGSEEACSLHYDQAAIERFMTKYFKPDNMEVVSTMAVMVNGNKILVGQMSPSTLTAHCAQVRRAAKYYGFTQ
jgi:hypothetical protein